MINRSSEVNDIKSSDLMLNFNVNIKSDDSFDLEHPELYFFFVMKSYFQLIEQFIK